MGKKSLFAPLATTKHPERIKPEPKIKIAKCFMSHHSALADENDDCDASKMPNEVDSVSSVTGGAVAPRHFDDREDGEN